MAYYRCGPTATIGNRTSWGPVSTTVDPKYDRPLSGNYDRIFNAFERTNAFEYIRSSFEGKEDEDRHIARADIVVNRKMSSSYERADCALAAQTPCSEDEEFYREKILYSQARQLYPLQEDLADWINKTIGISYLTGENFLDVLDNGAELCQLATVIHDRARECVHQGLIVGPVPQIRGRCWQRAARRSFFSRDNTENFITFCRDLGVHENLLFESDDLVLHNQPRQVILCLLEVARLATKFGVEPPGLVQLEKEIALEERDSGLDSNMSSAAWQFRDLSPLPDHKKQIEPPPSPVDDNQLSVDNADAESTKSGGTVDSSDSDVPLKPTNELDKRVQLVTRLMERGCSCGEGKCSKLLKVKKVGEGRYNIAGRNVFIRLLKGRHMMVRVGGGWDTLEHFLSRHEPCQVRLVTPGRRAALLPLPAPPPSPPPSDAAPSPPPPPRPARSTPSPRPASTPSPRLSSGQTSPVQDIRRSSTPKPNKHLRSSLTLPLKEQQPRPRKQSAPSLSVPSTPTPRTPTPRTPTTRTVKTPPNEHRKSFPSTTNTTPKKSRSASLAPVQNEKKSFCGTEKLNRSKKTSRSSSVASTPSELKPRTTRSQSLASTPVEAYCGAGALSAYGHKSRSMSLALPAATRQPAPAPGLTQAAIEESIRLSLAASITDDHDSNKPFLHIKAKYRSPPPREVPPR